jgi:hypothetical protein
MGVTGNFKDMPLSELLQWVGSNRKSGVLKISSGRNTIQFVVENGRIVGCASNDPPTLLGQFLLSRGRIDEKALQEALAKQEQTGKSLGQILEEMKLVPETELGRYVVAKAEEMIFKLFEWATAQFEFDSGAKPDPSTIRLDIDVEHILLRGAQRQDEIERMKATFNNPGIVLCPTEHELHPETAASPMARRIYELVDGNRTFAEILLQSRASEFLATKFLYELYRRGVVCIKDVRHVPPRPGSPEAACELAERLSTRSEHEAALDVLQAALAEEPRNEPLLQLNSRIEAAFLQEAYRSEIPPSMTPVPVNVRSEIRDKKAPSPNELFVLDLIEGGAQDVKTVVRIAPLYEIDVVRALVALRRKGLIEFRETAKPETAKAPEKPAPEIQSFENDIDAEIERSIDRGWSAG